MTEIYNPIGEYMGKEQQGYSLFDVLGVGLSDVDPFTEEELGASYDQMEASGVPWTKLITRQEFIVKTLERQTEILADDLKYGP
jgi:hypothetical protein